MDIPVPVRRVGYRFAYAGLRAYWFVLRPRSTGIKCLLTEGDRVLLVRHTYGPRAWELPGGSLKREEEPLTAARREMQEELGISIDEWCELGEIEVLIDHHRDRVHCFQAELHAPEMVVDHGELAEVRWFPRNELPPNLGRYSRRILSRSAAER